MSEAIARGKRIKKQAIVMRQEGIDLYLDVTVPMKGQKKGKRC